MTNANRPDFQSATGKHPQNTTSPSAAAAAASQRPSPAANAPAGSIATTSSVQANSPILYARGLYRPPAASWNAIDRLLLESQTGVSG